MRANLPKETSSISTQSAWLIHISILSQATGTCLYIYCENRNSLLFFVHTNTASYLVSSIANLRAYLHAGKMSESEFVNQNLQC